MGGWVALILFAVTCVSGGGCAWLRWRSLAMTHVDLMERLALDAADTLTAPERGLEPADIERLRYPLQRARAFADSSRRRFEGAPWIAKFDVLLSAYGELVDYLDRARSRRIGGREGERAHALAGKVAAAADEVRVELEAKREARAPATSWPSPSPPRSAPGRCPSEDA